MASELTIAQARSHAVGLRSYWTYAQQPPSSIAEGIGRLEAAQISMDFLAWHAVTDDAIKAVIREFALVETALTQERLGITDLLCSRIPSPGRNECPDYTLDLEPDEDQKPPRLILLEAMHSAFKGEFFRAADSRGVVPWLNNSANAANAVASSLTNDTLPTVWFALIGILKTAAIPVSWVVGQAPLFGAEPAPAAILAALQTKLANLPSASLRFSQRSGGGICAQMPQELRGALHGALQGTIGRLQQDAASAALASVGMPAGGQLPGGGEQMLRPRAPSWLTRNAGSLSIGLAGILGGAWLAARR